MTRTALPLLAACSIWATTPPAAAQATPAPPPALDPLAEVCRAALTKVAPAIVRIDTVGGADPASGAAESQSAIAPAFRVADGPTTGVIWSPDGYIVTSSFNFVRDPTVITVALSDGRRFVARLVARDRAARIALLKIDASQLPTPEWLPVDRVQPGQWVLAAGYGHGSVQPAISLGIVSARLRMNGTAVLTDARLSPANYGGPLLDLQGRVLGVCVPLGPGADEIADAQWYDSGIGFAIHYDHLRDRVERMRGGRDPRRGLLGVVLDLRDPLVQTGDTFEPARETPPDATPDASPATPPAPPPGLRIIEPPVGPAAAAGLQAGDILTHIDGRPTPRPVDFLRALASRTAGDEIEVRYWRSGRTHAVRLTLASLDDLRSASAPASQPTE